MPRLHQVHRLMFQWFRFSQWIKYPGRCWEKKLSSRHGFSFRRQLLLTVSATCWLCHVRFWSSAWSNLISVMHGDGTGTVVLSSRTCLLVLPSTRLSGPELGTFTFLYCKSAIFCIFYYVNLTWGMFNRPDPKMGYLNSEIGLEVAF